MRLHEAGPGVSTYKATGIILRRHDYGEADRIYTILTPERKVSAIAKGIRRRTAKLASHLELFHEIELMLIPGKSLDIVTSARTLAAYSIAEDYERLRRGFLFLEMVDRLSDTEGTEAVYAVLGSAIAQLSQLPVSICELGFKLQLLDALGQAPDLSRPEPLPESLGLDIEQGVLSAADNPLAAPLTQDAIKLWRLSLMRPLGDLARIQGAEVLAMATLPVLDQFIRQQFGIRFNSAEI
ncbi:MAG: DNA repair protein RecO [Candidatus Saccharimonadales bacterium]